MVNGERDAEMEKEGKEVKVDNRFSNVRGISWYKTSCVEEWGEQEKMREENKRHPLL